MAKNVWLVIVVCARDFGLRGGCYWMALTLFEGSLVTNSKQETTKCYNYCKCELVAMYSDDDLMTVWVLGQLEL